MAKCVNGVSNVVVMGSADSVAKKVLNEGFIPVPANTKADTIISKLFGERLYGEITISAESMAELMKIIQETNKVIEEAEALKKEGLEAINTSTLEEMIQAEKANAEAKKLEKFKDVNETQEFNFGGLIQYLRVVYYKTTTKKGKTKIVKGLLLETTNDNKLSIIPSDTKAVERFPKKTTVSLVDVINKEPVVAEVVAKMQESIKKYQQMFVA